MFQDELSLITLITLWVIRNKIDILMLAKKKKNFKGEAAKRKNFFLNHMAFKERENQTLFFKELNLTV